ncbi:MAG: DUF6111 family protein [Alphaproteobacteria bacterium]
MIRIIIQIVVPLVLPTVAYLLWARYAGRHSIDELRRGPWLWLIAAGVVLVAISAGLWIALEEQPPGSTYVPPRFEDGQLVPGHFR